jgi:hypothetical protein
VAFDNRLRHLRYGFFVKAISAYRHHLRLDPFDDTVVRQEGIHPEP